MKKQTIGFIGGGRITRIILQAYENAQISFSEIRVFDPNEGVITALKTRYPYIVASTENFSLSGEADVVILAVHPPVMAETLTKLRGLLKKEAILISLAPKITLQKMQEILGGHDAMARINPSASSILNEGLNPVCYAPTVTAAQKEAVAAMMQPLGALPEVAEHKIEAYAMISAMGHTYFWPQLQKLKELAIGFGMDEPEAESVITDMMWGTTETLFNSGLSYEEVMDLIPVKPLGEAQPSILGYYDQYLKALFEKIKP
jgi:pyrroline-5-carboxylate reductase